ncbi:MAG: hypothetical protein ABJC39_04485, partial [Chloroflexota bacterium]
LVVGSVLTAALALVALPGLVGSRVPNLIEPIPAGAFQPLPVQQGPRSMPSIGPLDGAHLSASSITAQTPIVERPQAGGPASAARATVNQPDPDPGSVRRPPRSTLTGFATFYDNGTTAMRLPRGTLVVICGNGGCIERVVNDYGPQKPSRVVDLYRPDFFAVCGCPSFAGTTTVTVYIY